MKGEVNYMAANNPSIVRRSINGTKAHEEVEVT